MSVAMGFTNCRNDDMEGIIYIFLYLISDFQLPWTIYQPALTNREINLNQIRMLRCQPEVIEQVTQCLPTIRLQAYYRKLITAEFEAEPEYDELLSCFADFRKFSE